MNQWPFIVAAYGLAIVGTIGLWAASLLAMRKAERDADALRNRE